jgi:hypothetical protein
MFKRLLLRLLKIFYNLLVFPKKLKQMKKVLMAACLLVASQSMFAQINKGQWLVGGNISFESGKDGLESADEDDIKYSQFNFNPNAGYFLIDKLAVGLRANFYSYKEKNEDDAETNLLVGPFVRYYVLDASQKVNVFADAGFSFGSRGTDDKTSQNEFTISAGPAVFLSPNTALEFALYYKKAGGELYEDYKYSRFGLNIGFQIHLGNGKK